MQNNIHFRGVFSLESNWCPRIRASALGNQSRTARKTWLTVCGTVSSWNLGGLGCLEIENTEFCYTRIENRISIRPSYKSGACRSAQSAGRTAAKLVRDRLECCFECTCRILIFRFCSRPSTAASLVEDGTCCWLIVFPLDARIFLDEYEVRGSHFETRVELVEF